MLALATMVVALFLGFGAVQELTVRGLGAGETQPMAVGLVGTLASLLLLVSAIAWWRRWSAARRIAAAAGALSVAFHAYAALPPHRNVGGLALVVGVGYGLFLLWAARRGDRPPAHRAPAAELTR